MKQYCVGYINFFDNLLDQTFIWADSEKEAVLKYPGLEHVFPTEDTTMDDAKTNAYNSDCMFSVIRIT